MAGQSEASAAPAGDGEERIAAWLRANPGGTAWLSSTGLWHGTCPVDEARWLAAEPCVTAEELADALDGLTAACAEVRLTEAQFPGWAVRRWSDGIWRGVHLSDPDRVRGVEAPDAPRLREEIRKALAGLAAEGAAR